MADNHLRKQKKASLILVICADGLVERFQCDHPFIVVLCNITVCISGGGAQYEFPGTFNKTVCVNAVRCGAKRLVISLPHRYGSP
ncbi:hypothetical protein SDC9_153481 [bioreactor metagenome]|uniref:Uncharacterized protein n=1 Tax=bioreactor metagenome TaxID=1076179 RepID=A0A645EW31_9ZZZZ